MITNFAEPIYETCKKQLNDHALMERLKAEKFDLAMADYWGE